MTTLDEAFRAVGLDPVPVDGWTGARLPSERRGSFVLLGRIGERGVAFRAFIMRCPDREHHAVYHRLLAKNLDAADWRFAADDLGDVYLTAYVPAAALEPETFDRLLGGACAAVDGVYEGIVRAGFDIPDGVSLVPPSDER